MNQWAYRTVKNEKVKVAGIVFTSKRHTDYPQNGRFDNQRWCFGLYFRPGEEKPYMLCLWGSETLAKAKSMEAREALYDTPQERLLTNEKHEYCWEWWEPVNE